MEKKAHKARTHKYRGDQLEISSAPWVCAEQVLNERARDPAPSSVSALLPGFEMGLFQGVKNILADWRMQ